MRGVMVRDSGMDCEMSRSEIPLMMPDGMPTMPADMTKIAAVTVREVGLRDGLQSIARVLPTAQKLEWIRDAFEAGQREIEVGSFVPARLLPQLADTGELVAYAKTLPGLVASALVPNLKGAERAIESGADLHAAAAVRQSRAQPRQFAPHARRSGAGHRAHPCRARRRRIEVQDRGGFEHGVRLHDRGPRRAGRSAASPEGRIGCRRGLRRPRGHRRLRRSVDGADAVRAGVPHRRRAPHVRALPRHARAGPRERVRGRGRSACGASTRASPASGAVRTRRGPAATSRPKTSSISSAAWVSTPGRISSGCSRSARKLRRWLDGETLHGTLWRAGLPKTLRPRQPRAPEARGRATQPWTIGTRRSRSPASRSSSSRTW